MRERNKPTKKTNKPTTNNTMGYTHYWTYKPSQIENLEDVRKLFKRCIKQIKKFENLLCKKNNVLKLCGGLGEGKPIINESELWFNGEGKQGEDHETFAIYWIEDSNGFCKTAYKPYDLMVCLSLLTFARYFPENVFSFSSDGCVGEIPWDNAIFYYETFTGKVAKKQSIYRDQDKI